MKKYQLWLERKSYSQHLFNLLKIKYSTPPSEKRVLKHRRLQTTEDRICTQPSPHHNDPKDNYFNQASLGSTLNTSKVSSLKKGLKFNPMKSFDLRNSNASLAKRIKEVKPVINLKKGKKKPPTVMEYSRQKRVDRNYDNTND